MSSKHLHPKNKQQSHHLHRCYKVTNPHQRTHQRSLKTQDEDCFLEQNRWRRMCCVTSAKAGRKRWRQENHFGDVCKFCTAEDMPIISFQMKPVKRDPMLTRLIDLTDRHCPGTPLSSRAKGCQQEMSWTSRVKPSGRETPRIPCRSSKGDGQPTPVDLERSHVTQGKTHKQHHYCPQRSEVRRMWGGGRGGWPGCSSLLIQEVVNRSWAERRQSLQLGQQNILLTDREARPNVSKGCYLVTWKQPKTYQMPWDDLGKEKMTEPVGITSWEGNQSHFLCSTAPWVIKELDCFPEPPCTHRPAWSFPPRSQEEWWITATTSKLFLAKHGGTHL